MSLGKKTIIVALVLAVVATTVVLVVNFNKDQAAQNATGELTINTSPKTVDVKIGDKEFGGVETGDTLSGPVGQSLDIEIGHDGFEPFTKTVTLTTDEPTKVNARLLPVTDDAQALIDEEEELDFQKDETEKYLRDAEKAYQEYPILSDMPKEGKLFSAYQGVAKKSGYDFAVYVELYSGHEGQGREDFNDWMNEEKYNPDDYEIIEQVRDEQPSPIEKPTDDDLEALTRDGITLSRPVPPKGLSDQDLAVKFAKTTTTWDAEKDNHHTAALSRAESLMTKKQAQALESPTRPTTSSNWRKAKKNEARSYSWISDYEETKEGKNTVVTMETCWAWISTDAPYQADGPRTYTLTISGKKNDRRISAYTYEDPDPFVDNSGTKCDPYNR